MARPKGIRFLYAGIRVRNVDRSVRFYRSLGFRIRVDGRMEHGGRFVHLVLPGSPGRIELNYYPKSNRFYEPFRRGTEFDHFGFYVDDVARWIRRARRNGAPIVAPPWVEGKTRIGYVADPDGNWVEFFGPARPRRSARRAAA